MSPKNYERHGARLADHGALVVAPSKVHELDEEVSLEGHGIRALSKAGEVYEAPLKVHKVQERKALVEDAREEA